jgi:hypothetical protein
MLRYIFLIITGLFLSQCSTGVERSLDPGIVKVVLQSNPADSSIVILGETYLVDSSSVFNVQISQGKIYIDSYFSDLLPEIDDFQDSGNAYNILEKENDGYKQIKIFETFAPPDNFTKLQFALNANVLIIGGFRIPVELPEDAKLLVEFDQIITVKEGMTTEIIIQIEPLQSVVRYKDSFRFLRKLEIINISYY